MAGTEIQAGQIKGVLVLDGKKFNVGLQKAGKNSAKFEATSKKHSLGVAAGFQGINKSIGATILKYGALFISAKGMKDLIFKTAAMGDQFQKAAQRVGVSAETLSEFNHAAELSGASVETVENGFRLLAKRMLDANQGLAESKRTFEALDIGVTNVDGSLRNVDDVFMDAIDSINRLGSETEKTALAQELFGRSGTQLLPLIRQGKEGLAAMRQEARNLGITFNDVQANQAAEFQDSMTRVTAKLTGMRNQIGQALLPALTTLANHFARSSKDMDSKSQTLAQNMKTAFITIVKAGGLVTKAIDGIKLTYTSLQLAVEQTGTFFEKAALNREIAKTIEAMVDLAKANEAGAISDKQRVIQMAGLQKQLDLLTGETGNLDEKTVELFNDLMKQAAAIESNDIAFQNFVKTLEAAGDIETPALPGSDPEKLNTAKDNAKNAFKERIKAQEDFLKDSEELRATNLADFKRDAEVRRQIEIETFNSTIFLAEKKKQLDKKASDDRIAQIDADRAAIDESNTLAQDQAKNIQAFSESVWDTVGQGWANTTANFIANSDEMQDSQQTWAQMADDLWDSMKEKAIATLLSIVGQQLTQAAIVASGWAPAAAFSATATGGATAGAAVAAIAGLFSSIGKFIPSKEVGGPVSEGLTFTHDDEFVLSRMQTGQVSALLTKLNDKIDTLDGGGSAVVIKPKGDIAQKFFQWFNVEVETNKRRAIASGTI